MISMRNREEFVCEIWIMRNGVITKQNFVFGKNSEIEIKALMTFDPLNIKTVMNIHM